MVIGANPLKQKCRGQYGDVIGYMPLPNAGMLNEPCVRPDIFVIAQAGAYLEICQGGEALEGAQNPIFSHLQVFTM